LKGYSSIRKKALGLKGRFECIGLFEGVHIGEIEYTNNTGDVFMRMKQGFFSKHNTCELYSSICPSAESIALLLVVNF